jgi:Mn2+/Fe2+ NRAMP family transporter
MRLEHGKNTPFVITKRASMLSKHGPGLITGAADVDPSGIAVYSQGGGQFG